MTLRQFAPLKRLHFILIAILLLGHTLVHYAVLIPEAGEVVEGLPFVDLHVLHESEYLVVIAYASWIFRLRGGLAALAVTGLAAIPFIFASQIHLNGYGSAALGTGDDYGSYAAVETGFGGLGNAAIEVGVLLAIGAFILFINERWAREHDAKTRPRRTWERRWSN